MSSHLTPGQRALREAARLEAARVYGGLVPGKNSRRSLLADRAEQLLADLPRRRAEASVMAAEARPAAPEQDPAAAELAAGYPVHEVMERYGLTYAEVRTIRKQTMSGGAA